MTEIKSQLVLNVTTGQNRMNRDSFFQGSANTLALQTVEDWQTWRGTPQVLTGPDGAGKSHLAHIFAAASGAPVLCAAALGADAVPMVADLPALVLEDAHELANNTPAQTEAFHLFNQARDLKQALLITGRGPVRDWGLTLPDLSSRLTATAQIRVTNPDEPMLLMVLVKLFADRQLAVPLETVEYAVHRMERSFDTAQALVAALDETNLRHNRRITKPMIRDTLTRLSKGSTLLGGPE